MQEYNLNTGDDSNPRLLKNIIYFPVVRPLYNQYFDLIFYSPKLLITFYANNPEECKNLLNNKRFRNFYFSVAQKLHGETYSDSLNDSEKIVLRQMVFYLLRNNNESFKNFVGEDLSFLEFFQQDSEFIEFLACFNEQQVRCLHAIAFGEDWSADKHEKPFSLCLT